MDRRDPPRPLKQCLAAPKRMGGGRITLRRIDLQRRLELSQLARGLPDDLVLPLLACRRAASTLWPHGIRWRGGWLPRHTGGTRTVPRPVCAWSTGWWVAHAVDGGYGGLASAGTRTRYTRLWAFPAYAAVAFGWVCGSPHAEGHGEEGRLGLGVVGPCMMFVLGASCAVLVVSPTKRKHDFPTCPCVMKP